MPRQTVRHSLRRGGGAAPYEIKTPAGPAPELPARLLPSALPVPLRDPTERAGRWFGLRQMPDVNIYEVISRVSYVWRMYVRVFLTDESVFCRGRATCINRIIRPLSPIYEVRPNTRYFLYADPASDEIGVLRPGIRTRIFWSVDPRELVAGGTALLIRRAVGDYPPPHSQVDNTRLDNRKPGPAVVICGINKPAGDCDKNPQFT